jgi:FkbM family methyltransferase
MNHLYHMLLRRRNRGITPSGFIDVGAHFGETRHVIHAVYPDKRVVSFEANPHCEPMLKQAGAESLICLLGDKTVDKVQFYLNPNDITSTGSSIYKEKSHFFENAAMVELPMYRLDEVVPAEAKLDFLKMDVQGAELKVLDGATKLLPTIKWIYLEVSFVSLNEGSPLFDHVFDHLRRLGYRISDIADPTWIDNELVQCNFLFEKA